MAYGATMNYWADWYRNVAMKDDIPSMRPSLSRQSIKRDKQDSPHPSESDDKINMWFFSIDRLNILSFGFFIIKQYQFSKTLQTEVTI